MASLIVAPKLLNVAVLVVLISDQERAAGLRLGLRGRQATKSQAREEDGKGSYSHGKLPARQSRPARIRKLKFEDNMPEFASIGKVFRDDP